MVLPVLVAPGRLEVQEVPVPAPGPGELLLEVEVALTCGTDVKTYRRGHPKIPFPAPLGHEFAGRVAAVGKEVAGFHDGDPLACVPTAPCRVCALCRRGRENLCPAAMDEMVLGAFAPFVRLPARLVRANVFVRPAGMSAVTAAALEPLACVVHGASRVPVEEARTVAILGDGPIALLFLQLVRARSQARVALAGKHAVRLRAAWELGAERVVGSTEHGGRSEAGPGAGTRAAAGGRAGRVGSGGEGPAHPEQLGSSTDRDPYRDLSGHDGAREPGGAAGRARGEAEAEGASRDDPFRDALRDLGARDGRADVVIECVGSPAAWERAVRLAAPGATVLLFGGCPAGSTAALDTYAVHYEEVDVRGAFHYSPRDVREALDLLAAGTVRVEPLITHRLPLSRLSEALDLVIRREAIKVAVVPGSGMPERGVP